MLNDEFEKEFAASMDDLEEIDTINTITIPPPASATALTTSKLAKFKRLPEIAENIATTSVSPTPSDLLYRVPTDVLAASVGGDLRKTVLINNSANEILSSSPLSSTTLLNESDNMHSDVANNNFTNGNKSTNDNSNNHAKHNNDDEDGAEMKSTAPRRKFIVTRMDSKVLLRPEAEQLRNFSAKSNAATISFPCSSAINRTPLTSLFASNRSMEPHLDKRFFDTSLVRINANSSQSLNASNTSNASSQENSLNLDGDIWERRKEVGLKPRVQVIVSSIRYMSSYEFLVIL